MGFLLLLMWIDLITILRFRIILGSHVPVKHHEFTDSARCASLPQRHRMVLVKPERTQTRHPPMMNCSVSYPVRASFPDDVPCLVQNASRSCITVAAHA
jgi:hypothetical protein